MNWDIIEGGWNEFKTHVKAKWSRLSDAELDRIEGKREQLARNLQKAYGLTEQQAEVQVSAFEKLHADYAPVARP